MPPKKKAKTTATQPPKKKAKGKNTAQPRKKEEAQSREPLNGAIIKHFRELSKLYSLKKDHGRASAFGEFIQFADDGEHYCGDVVITSAKQVQKLLVERPYIQESGWRIGKSTFEEIDEFCKTGTSKRLEELRPSTLVAKVSANTYLVKMLYEKALAEDYDSIFNTTYSNACYAIKRCEHTITSGEEAMKLKGFDESSAELIEKALEESPSGVAKKKTQTVSLDKRAQAKLLRDKASAFEAEATVEERIHELLEPAKVSANTWLLKVFHKKASAEVMLSHKKKAYLDAGFAIKECEHEITSGEDAMELKGVGKSSASLIDKALEEREKVSKSFFDVESKGVREAVASLPKDAEITLTTDGVLLVNGVGRANYHARGCPFELTLGGKTWVVDGTMDYGGTRDWCGVFEGTLTHKKEVVSISLTSGNDEQRNCDYHGQWDYFEEEEEQEIKDALNDEVFSAYEWNYIE